MEDAQRDVAGASDGSSDETTPRAKAVPTFGSMCGVAGCVGYNKKNGYACTHIFTRPCDVGEVCRLPHASYGLRAWTCQEAKALAEVVKPAAGRNAAFKSSYADWQKGGSSDVAAVKAQLAKQAKNA